MITSCILKELAQTQIQRDAALTFPVSLSNTKKKDRKTVWLISKGAYSSFYQDFVAVFICCRKKNQMVAAWWCMWVKMRHHLACTVGDEAKVKQQAGLNVDQARPCALQPERQCFSSAVLTWRLMAAGPLSVALPSLEPSGFPQFTGGYSDICGQDSEYREYTEYHKASGCCSSAL